MTEEIVDIIDTKGTVQGQMAKAEAHKTGALHKTVIAEIRNSKGDWILVKQAADRQDAGQYVSPIGGHVQAGESDIEALNREAFEETGLTEFEYELVGKFVFERQVIGRHENHYFVVFKITSDEDLTLNHEAVSYQKFPEDKLKQAIAETPDLFGGAFFALLKELYPEMLV